MMQEIVVSHLEMKYHDNIISDSAIYNVIIKYCTSYFCNNALLVQ